MDARELEVRCLHCNAGFAAGTRTCIHCQRRLGSDAGPLRTLEGEPFGGSAEREPAEAGTEKLGLWGRIGPGVLAVVFIGISLLSKLCAGEFSH